MQTKLIIGVVAIGGVFLLVALMNGGKDAPVTQGMAETKTENTTMTAVTVPADMPTDVPMYPGAVLTAVQDVSQSDARNITLSLLTPDSVADVNTWYRGALKTNGWAVTSDKNVGGYVLLKGERENVAVFMQAANGENGVVITERIQIK